MPAQQNEEAWRIARSEAAKRGAETRRRNAAAPMKQQQPRSVFIIDGQDENEGNSTVRTSLISSRYTQKAEIRGQSQVRLWNEAGSMLVLENKAIIAAFVAGMIFMYLLSGPSDETRIILRLIEDQGVMIDGMVPNAKASSGVVAAVKNAGKVAGAGLGGHILEIVSKFLVSMGFNWYFKEGRLF